MAATFGGALKAFLEGQALGLSVTADRTRKDQKPPYCTYSGDLALIPDGMEDGTVDTAAETFQLDLWQLEDDESPTLADVLTKLLHGYRTSYGTPSKTVYGVVHANRVRLVEMAELGRGPAVSVVHHVYTLEVRRQV